MYDKKFISVTSHALGTPLPSVTNCHTFSDPLLRLERDVLYGRPRWSMNVVSHLIILTNAIRYMYYCTFLVKFSCATLTVFSM